MFDQSYESLLSVAFEFRKQKLWKKLLETELFAVQLSSGEVGYCCITGTYGEHLALALYIGQAGIDSLRSLNRSFDFETVFERHEAAVAQVCLQCSYENLFMLDHEELQLIDQYTKKHGITLRGKNSCPSFRTYTAGHIPWTISEEDYLPLYEALLAAMEISRLLESTPKRALGFRDVPLSQQEIPFVQPRDGGFTLSSILLPPPKIIDDPIPSFRNDILLAKLRKQKKTDQVWAYDIVMQTAAVTDEKMERGSTYQLPATPPFYPYVQFVMNPSDDYIISTDAVCNLTQESAAFLETLTQNMLECGIPATVQVQNRRAENFLSDFASKVGFQLHRVKTLPQVNEILEDMLCPGDLPDLNDPDNDEVFQRMMELDDAALMTAPVSVKIQLLKVAKNGLLPDALAKRIISLFELKP